MLREECTPSSSWWEDVQHHHNDQAHSINSMSFYHKNSNGNSNANASEEDNLSISTLNASNRLDLTAESSNHHSLEIQDQPASDKLFRDHAVSSHNHLWSLAFLPNRSLGDQIMDQHQHHHHITSSRNSSTTSELPFETACDNGNSNGWIYDQSTNQVRYNQSSEQRLSKLTDLVGKHWSIAPPNNPDMNHNLHHHFDHDQDQTKDDVSMFREALEVKNEEELCYNNGLSGGGSLFHDQIQSSRSFLDIRLSRPLTDINPSFKPCFKALNLSEFNKKEHHTPSLTSVRLGTTNSGKKKRCEEISDEVSKKAKCDGGSTLSPEKEIPKAKLRDKITTLQQIVSPFGKTDTASVLQEAITYINFYQEQVKLLSTPYMKNSSIKDRWGGWEREEEKRRGHEKHRDLKSRGLCLVPISCTPMAYRDNSATDYWSPSHRSGSLYR